MEQIELFFDGQNSKLLEKQGKNVSFNTKQNIVRYLENFTYNGGKTRVEYKNSIPYFINEFWTAKQRQGNKIHEISYRACFKPQLPEFFIQALSQERQVIYDPFMGRGTTIIQANLMNRVAIGNDINPLSLLLVRPRLHLVEFQHIYKRLQEINLNQDCEIDRNLLAFFHVDTLKQITNLRNYFIEKDFNKTLDFIDDWIRLVAINRLTGHSSGFFSVYTLPPNQAVSVEKQIKFNEQRQQTPPKREVKEIILKKSKVLLSGEQSKYAQEFLLINESAHHTPQIADQKVDLLVTSPPFLDIVDYASDNWLRGWFANIDVKNIPITILKNEQDWQNFMRQCFIEFARVVKKDGYIAFEVGELRNGKILLEELVIKAIADLPLHVEGVMVNEQNFTKTANIWGVKNNKKGTNTNRIVIIRRV